MKAILRMLGLQLLAEFLGKVAEVISTYVSPPSNDDDQS